RTALAPGPDRTRERIRRGRRCGCDARGRRRSRRLPGEPQGSRGVRPVLLRAVRRRGVPLMNTYGFSAPSGLLSDEQSFASFVCLDTNGHDIWTLIEDPTMERVRGVIENVLRVGP